MAESSASTSEIVGAPPTKKPKGSDPVAKVSAEARAKQFEDLYADGDILFCRYCSHSVDFVRVDYIKDHLKSKKHLLRKEAKGGIWMPVTSVDVERSFLNINIY